ncbi:MAG: flagellar basal body-associated FliL family protein [Rhodoferax sp.]
MSAKAETAPAPAAPAKSKKLLIIIVAAVLLLVVAGAGAFMFLKNRNAVDDEEGGAAHEKPAAHAKPTAPPVYLPIDNMVVNLADPGGERVAQVGITLEVLSAEAATSVKAYMPTIRSGILLLISKRTADELLSAEGKEKLAADILHETSLPFGGGEEEEEEPPVKKGKKAKKPAVQYPVVKVLFSSFIVQ